MFDKGETDSKVFSQQIFFMGIFIVTMINRWKLVKPFLFIGQYVSL